MKKLRLIPVCLVAWSAQAPADATLTYELIGPDSTSNTKTLAIARFFARVDDTEKKDTYLIYQAGKFFPLFEVDPAEKTYTRLTPEVRPTLHAGVRPASPDAEPADDEPSGETTPAASPAESAVAPAAGADEKPASADRRAAAPSSENASDAANPATADQPDSGGMAAAPAEPLPATPELRASREKREVAGVECRVVEEMSAGRPVLEHCMANKARLGITEREIRTLARTFVMARERELGWLGAATEDEEFVSIQTLDPVTGARLVLQKVSTAPLPEGHLRIPRDYIQRNP